MPFDIYDYRYSTALLPLIISLPGISLGYANIYFIGIVVILIFLLLRTSGTVKYFLYHEPWFVKILIYSLISHIVIGFTLKIAVSKNYEILILLALFVILFLSVYVSLKTQKKMDDCINKYVDENWWNRDKKQT